MKEKICHTCKVTKPLNEYNNCKISGDGKYHQCKKCRYNVPEDKKKANYAYQREYRIANKEEVKRKDRLRYQKTKERKLKQQKEHRERLSAERILEIKARQTRYDKDKASVIKKRKADYYIKNIDRIRIRVASTRVRRCAWRSKKYKEDPVFKFRCLYASRISDAFKRNGWKNTETSIEMLGVEFDVAKRHIERQFKKGMSWENHGYRGWHIDHKIPLASAKTIEEIKVLCHYLNLQPLWAKENLEKSDTILPIQTTMCI